MEWDELRKIYLSILSDEGFRPEIDSDGDVHFKYEGGNYYILEDHDEQFVYILYPNFWAIDSSEEQLKALKAAATATRTTKAAKVLLTPKGDNVSAAFESLVSAPSEIPSILVRALRCVQSAVNKFKEEMNKNDAE
jgi:hypothetical protein